MKKTGEEIIELLGAAFEEEGILMLYHQDYDVEDLDESIRNFKCVEDKTETSGYAHCIYYFEDHDVYIKLKGFYNSYDSRADYDESSSSDLSVVTPQKKTITVYE